MQHAINSAEPSPTNDIVLEGLDGLNPIQIRIEDGALPRKELNDLAVHRTEVGLKVGRRSTNDIPLSAICVSRRHAKLLYWHERLVVIDTASSNGTFVDGQRIEPWRAVPLPIGAEISFGGGARLQRTA